MPPDLNLLLTLDVLLQEGSVARAAQRLRLSPSATSRALARLRETTGDPLLVRAGRGLVPTPRALELRARVGHLVDEAQALLRPQESLDPARLSRTFALRAGEGFAETFGPALIDRVENEAPLVRLNFLPKPDRDSAPLRDGSVDFEVGVIDRSMGPEVRVRGLFRDRFVGVVRREHELAQGEMTLARYAGARHVATWRQGGDRGPVEKALEPFDAGREIVTLVGGFSAALALVRNTDLIATVPEISTAFLREGLHSFALPVPPPEVTVSLLWHPRMDADPGHRWLRQRVRDACSDVLGNMGLAPTRPRTEGG